MRSLAARLALAGLFVGAWGVAGYLLWITESRAHTESSTFRTFESAALTAEREALDLRAAQAAYVAAGQGEPFWIQKVSSTTASLRDALVVLRGTAASPEAQSAADNAAGALQDFEQVDRRARDYARGGQKLLASDLIFADGLEITSAVVTSINQARSLETQARDARLASARRLELIAVGGAAAIGLLALLLMTPVPRSKDVATIVPARETPAASVPAAATDPGAALDRSFRNTAPRHVAVSTSVDFNTIATLCGDLARVVDTRALPAILDRAATVLDATGIVLWIADPDGRELSPIVTHGYSPSMVARLGTILNDAENATASAFRTGLMQTVRADAVSNGAIAAPLVTPAGPVGVMAAEVRHEGEQDAAKLAAAAIVAAQLATLVGPPSTRAQAKSEAV